MRASALTFGDKEMIGLMLGSVEDVIKVAIASLTKDISCLNSLLLLFLNVSHIRDQFSCTIDGQQVFRISKSILEQMKSLLC